MSTFHQRSPIGFAHRGGKAHFRENTLDAFRHALKSGLKGLETDARMTREDHIILHNDSHVWTQGYFAFAFDAQEPEIIDFLIDIGVDGIYSDHVDRLVSALQKTQAI